MEAVASKPLDPAWKGRLSLSTRRPPELYEKSDDIGDVPHAGALRTTFNVLRASAVFCVQDLPTVVILSVDEYDRPAVTTLHAALWNQGLASLLVVVSGDTVRVFTLARISRDGDKSDFHSRCLVRTLDLVDDALALPEPRLRHPNPDASGRRRAIATISIPGNVWTGCSCDNLTGVSSVAVSI